MKIAKSEILRNSVTILVAITMVGAVFGCTKKGAVPDPANPVKGEKQSQPEAESSAPLQSPEEKAREMAVLMSRSVDVNNKEGLEALKKEDYTKAEKLFLVALRQVDNYPKQSARKAMILNNLASVYEAKEMYFQAIPLLSKAQKLFIKAYGRKDPTVSITLSNMGRILSKQYRYEEASYVYKTAISLMEESGNTASDDYKQCLDALLIALRKTGQGLQAASLEKKISGLKK